MTDNVLEQRGLPVNAQGEVLARLGTGGRTVAGSLPQDFTPVNAQGELVVNLAPADATASFVTAKTNPVTGGLRSLNGGDLLIDYTPIGTDAVATTVQSKLREKPSLQDFGLIGNGSDETVKIQNAINACYGKALYITGGGTYLHTGLSITGEISILGDGQTTLKSSGVKCFSVTGHTIDGLIIDGVKFVNISETPTTDASAVIYGTSCTITNARITNNDMSGFLQGISISGGNYSKSYTDSFGVSYTTEGLDGRCIISGNYIHDTVSSYFPTIGAPSIYTQDSGYWDISGNRIENMQGSILAPQYGLVDNNIIINVTKDNGIYCAHSSNVSIVGNYIEKTKSDGIALNDSHNCAIMGNVIVNPENSGIRLQQGSGHAITGNKVIGKSGVTGSYMRCAIDAGSPDAPYNINISGNSFSGGLANSTNPFAFGSVPIGSAFTNWRFTNNTVRDVDTTPLASVFYGPYNIIIFGGTPLNVIVSDNLFSEVKEAPVNSQGLYQYISATKEYNNTISHSAGYATVPVVDSIIRDGSVRFSCGASGAVLNTTYNGLVSSVTIGASAGQYTVTFSRSISVRDFSWSASLANAPYFIRMDVVGPAIVDEWVSSVTVTMYNLTGVATWPNYNASIILYFCANGGGLGVY